MAQTVGQHGVAAFTNPSNGDPLDATVVKANDNSVRGAYVDHDNDGGIHLQSSTLAARPVAGTVGRKWLTTDSGSVKLWFDNGSAWEEISYVPSTGNPSFTNATLNGTTTNAGTISGGTISGGTVAPTTLTVPSGTTIPTHTETGTITATGSTRNGGTLSGATLNNTTFTGTVTGINTTPTAVVSRVTGSGSPITLSVTSYTDIASLSIPSAGTWLFQYAIYGSCTLNTGYVSATVEMYSRCYTSEATSTFFYGTPFGYVLSGGGGTETLIRGTSGATTGIVALTCSAACTVTVAASASVNSTIGTVQVLQYSVGQTAALSAIKIG